MHGYSGACDEFASYDERLAKIDEFGFRTLMEPPE
jgi:hypothetical protein